MNEAGSLEAAQEAAQTGKGAQSTPETGAGAPSSLPAGLEWLPEVPPAEDRVFAIRDEGGSLTPEASAALIGLRAQGLTRPEVAERLGITERAVRYWEAKAPGAIESAQKGLAKQLHRLVREAADRLAGKMDDSGARVLADVISKLGNLALAYEGKAPGQGSNLANQLNVIAALPDDARRAVLDALRGEELERQERQQKHEQVAAGVLTPPSDVGGGG